MKKYLPFISIVLLVILIVSLFFYPQASGLLSLSLLVAGLGMALFFTFQKHIGPYKQGQITGPKFTRNVLLDMLGFILTIAAASYFGGGEARLAGEAFDHSELENQELELKASLIFQG